MTNRQLKFHQAFSKLGGLFDPSEFCGYNDENDLIFFSTVKEEAYRIIENTIKPKYQNLPEINVDFINNLSLNAAATIKDGEYFIGINIGTYYLVYDMFNKMMANSNILPKIGNSTVESGEKRTISGYYSDGLVFDEINFQETQIIPKDQKRDVYAKYFSSLAIGFLIYHECGHIIRGHVDYCHSVNEEIFNELDNQKLTGKITSDHSQTLEMDADSFAFNRSMILAQSMFDNQNFRNEIIKEAYQSWETFISNWFFSIYSLFRLFGFNDFKIEIARQKTHPPATIRVAMILDNLATRFLHLHGNDLTSRVTHSALKSIEQTEEAFLQITFHENALNKVISIYGDDDLSNYIRAITDNWNNVRDLLVPYALGDLPKLKVID